MKTRVAILVAGISLFGATTASAQLVPWEDRAFVNLSFGAQTKVRTEDANFAFPIYGENATAGYTREVKGGSFPDIMVGARLTGNLGAAFHFNTRSDTRNIPFTGSIPDPIEFDKPRAVADSLPDMVHKERWMSLLAVYMMPASDKIDVLLFAGPSVVKLDHEVASITVAGVAEPQPTLTFTRETLSRSVFGFAAGADVQYMFTKMIGVGAFVKVQSATVNLPGNLKEEVGGTMFGAGLRLRFK